MALRQVTKYVNVLSSNFSKCQRSAVSPVNPFLTRTRPMHLSSASDQSWSLRLEGIQGPVSGLPTMKESRKILKSAAKDANAGFSQQGVQGCLHTQQPSQQSRSSMSAKLPVEWELEDTACPQGIQGCTEAEGGNGHCGYFDTWLDNCRRYGLSDCDQQLQGIQSGRVTLAQVLADQEARIADIAESYRKRKQELPNMEDESLQGAQGDLPLPAVDSPCPQGVQGDDCVRFKLWLDNCHRFGLHECLQQLQGFQSGRVTLAQVFAEQDAMIKEVVQQHQQKRN
ncbi:hypothetical protein ACOMHN_016873 [Nucella lapillus]